MSIVRDPRSGIWYLDFYDSTGKRRRQSAGTRSERKAQRQLERVKAKVTERRLGIFQPAPKPIAFGAFAEIYLRDHSSLLRDSKSDEYRYRKHLKPRLEYKQLAAIDASTIAQLRAELALEMAPATVNRVLSLLRGMLSRAVEWGYLVTSPARGLKLLKEPTRERVLSREEERRLIAACRQCKQPGLAPLVIVGLNGGLRPGELLELEWSHVDLRRRQLRVVRTKTDEDRVVDLNRPAIAALEEMKGLGTGKGRVFGIVNNLTRNFRLAVEKAGLETRGDERVTPHTLRHSFCTRLAQAGVDVKTIMQLAGHRQVSTVLRYMHPKSGKAAVESIEDDSEP